MLIQKFYKVLCMIVSFVTLTLGACNSQFKCKDDLAMTEFYSVLNDLIRLRYSDVKSVRIETLQVYRTHWGSETNANTDTISPPPPPVGFVSYTSDLFENQIWKKHLDTLDVKYMQHSIDTTKPILLDSARLSIPVISKQKFDSIFRVDDLDSSYQTLRELYGSSCFIEVSTPIFNKNCTKMIISINYMCGPLEGYGSIFLLERKQDKWSVIDEWDTWVS